MSWTREQFRNALAQSNVQAFLAIVRTGEGTLGASGYRTHFGGSLFDSYDDHPRKVITAKSGSTTLSSSAAGAYQFLTKTWDWINGIYKWSDFSPANQDEAAVALIAHRGALVDILAGRLETALAKCAKEWASLPGSPYGQPTISLTRAQKIWNDYHAVPVEERVITVIVKESAQEEEMNPFVITAVLKALEFAPDLIRLFGNDKKNVERNAEAASMVVEIAKSVTGMPTAEAAITQLEEVPELQAVFREQVYERRQDFEAVIDKRVEAAREFVSTYREGQPSVGRFTFPELMSTFFLFGGYAIGVYVVGFATDLSAELKAAVVGALVVQAVSDVRGFWFGNTAAREHDEDRRKP